MELKITELSKTYSNGVQALKNVNLTIGSGMFGLLGPNGAGKSSLMRTIATLQEPDNGSITFNDLNVLTQKEEVRKILGYLPQEFGVYPKISAEVLLDHLAVLKGVTNKKERKELVKALLHKTNLYDARKKNLGGYSGGMKQRFGIAQALLSNPQLIIVDEPTAGLDPAERNRFHNLLSELGENTVVILSTHIVDDVKELCTNMAIINKGEVLHQGNPLSAIDEIAGKVWRKTIDKTELEAYRGQYNVITERMIAGKPLIHVFGDQQPDPSFQSVEADLEDVYFSYIFGTKATSAV
jgi:ABC-type multidrug transport system ATPase subunit